MIHQAIINIAQICVNKGIHNVVISPGSRSAPLTLVFSRHPSIETYVINDERSAGFVALGLAQSLREPVALICTSGSAGYNYAPAVAEAFFSEVPLVVFTADRPPEWIDQKDGQTIRQNNLFGSNCKKSFQIPVNPEHKDEQWHVERMISEGLNAAIFDFPNGPVHFNVPFREPFYPGDQEIKFQDANKIILTKPDHVEENWNKPILKRWWDKYQKKLLVIGQMELDSELIKEVSSFSEKHSIPVVSDIISNGHQISNAIRHQDLFLIEDHEDLKPELVISLGKSVISKNLKLFLRKNKPKEHWQIQPHQNVSDTFQALSRIIETQPLNFFRGCSELSTSPNPMFNAWKNKDQETAEYIAEFFTQSNFNEMECVKNILEQIPENSNLHLANSMSVRYANYIGLEAKNIEVFANRGTSGIDGSTSTAMGAALGSPEKLNFLITGDMAFFYDRNAFWNAYLPKNLRIILLNNHAGVIFGNIPGPQSLPEDELEKLFEGYQPLSAQSTAEEFGLNYFHCKSFEDQSLHLPKFLDKEQGASILEIETDKKINKQIFKEFKEIYKGRK